MPHRLAPLSLAAALLVLIAACAPKAAVKREDARKSTLIGGLLGAPGTEKAVLDWIAVNAHERDRSVDLVSNPAYVETALAADSSVPRIGYFFLKDPWRVAGTVFWLSKSELPPKTGAESGVLWGMRLFQIEGSQDRYAPDAHLVLRTLYREFVPPAAPAVSLPNEIFIKTATRTFHRDRYFAVVDGRIWFKRHPDRDGTVKEPWRLLGDGLPWARKDATQFDRPQRIVQISADGDDLFAIDDKGRGYLCTTASTSVSSRDGWEDGWGFPGKRPLYLDGRAASSRSFAIGRRAEHALYFEDAIGNPHHMGPMGTTTLYVLHRDGGEILFTDNGLPNDFSRNLCGPDDGRFEAESLSASASTMFVIDRFGRMLTRFEDYDLNGGTPNFEYTYRSVIRPEDKGDVFGTSMSPYFLPLPPWKWHAPPALEGQARIGREITVLQTGLGNAARELRIAGIGPLGEVGYYSKEIEGAVWKFVPAPQLELDRTKLLPSDEVRRGAEEHRRTNGRLAESTLPRNRTYRGTWTGHVEVPDATAKDPATADLKPLETVTVALDWNPYCPPGKLKFSAGATPFEATLHTVDLWTPERRQRPGFDGTPLLLLGTLVFADEVLTDERPEVRAAMKHLRPFHHQTFGLLVALDDTHLEVRAIDEGVGKKFPLAIDLKRVGLYDPPEPAAVGDASRGSLSWLRGADLGTLVDSPVFQVDPRTAPVEALSAALNENKKLQQELKATLEAHEARLKAVAEFADRWRFVAPLLPLGRVNLLPKLLSLETVRGQRVAVGAQTQWPVIDLKLRTRILEYEAALKSRGVQ